MKCGIVVIVLFLSLSSVFGQQRRDKKILGNDINPIITKGPGYVKYVRRQINPLTENDLVIIGHRIYGGKAALDFKLNKDSVVFIRSIIDQNSKSGIKRIFFYESKTKP